MNNLQSKNESFPMISVSAEILAMSRVIDSGTQIQTYIITIPNYTLSQYLGESVRCGFILWGTLCHIKVLGKHNLTTFPRYNLLYYNAEIFSSLIHC